MSRAWEKVFYVLTWLFMGSNYLSAYGYGVMHRMHHAFADTEEDPHSPKFSKNLFDMMWRTRIGYININRQKIEVEDRFKSGAVQWKTFDKFADSRFNRFIWALVIIGIYAAFATSWWLWLLLPVHLIMAPVQGAMVNWFSHIIGYRNFNVKDTSTNSLPFDFLLLGENYHNNHHKFSGRANFGGVRWHEIDITYQIIKIFDKLGIVQLNQTKKLDIKPDFKTEQKTA